MTYSADLEQRLAQCDALKQQLEAYKPLSAEQLKTLRQFYRVSLTYTSNALEGNTLSESETKVVLEDGLTIAGKPLKDHLEATHHAKALDSIYALLEQPFITEQNVLEINQLVLGEPHAGYRSQNVIITGTPFVPPNHADVPQHMQQLMTTDYPQWVDHPIVTAAKLHLDLVTIHPFMDGNGRTARLVMNLQLLKTGYAHTIIPPVCRAEYIGALRTAQVDNNPAPFISFIVERAYEALKEQQRLLSIWQDNTISATLHHQAKLGSIYLGSLIQDR